MRRLVVVALMFALMPVVSSALGAGQPALTLQVGQTLDLGAGQWRGDDEVSCGGNRDRLEAPIPGFLGPAPLGQPVLIAAAIKNGLWIMRHNHGIAIWIKVVSDTSIVLRCTTHA